MTNRSEQPVPKARILPPVVLLAGIFAIMALHQFLPLAWLWRPPQTASGLFPIIVGFGLVLRCAYLFHRHRTTIKPFEESAELIVEGPYRWSRNPIYLGMVLVLLGCAILSGAASVWVVPPLFVTIIHWRFVVREEAMLAENFGLDFEDYCRKVRRWI